MKAFAVDRNEVECMKVVEFESVGRAREWVAFMNANGCNYQVVRASEMEVA